MVLLVPLLAYIEVPATLLKWIYLYSWVCFLFLYFSFQHMKSPSAAILAYCDTSSVCFCQCSWAPLTQAHWLGHCSFIPTVLSKSKVEDTAKVSVFWVLSLPYIVSILQQTVRRKTVRKQGFFSHVFKC